MTLAFHIAPDKTLQGIVIKHKSARTLLALPAFIEKEK